MINRNIPTYLSLAALFVLIPIAGLWSWNTLSELFGFPQAEFRHALAAFCLLAILRWLFVPGSRWRHREHGVADGTAHH